MLKILDLYIGRTILMTSVLTLTVLIGLSSMFRFIDQMRSIGRGYYDMVHAALFTLYSVPGDVVIFFPMAALIGGLIGLGMLASNSELVVMQAAGLSRLNIISSVMKSAVLMVLVMMAIAEWGAPVSDRAARELRIKAISDGNLFAARQGVWAKDGDSFVNIKEVDDVGNLQEITIYQFDENLALQQKVTAISAVYIEDAWRLQQVTALNFTPEQIIRVEAESQRWRSTLTPEKLGVVTVKPEMLSLQGLIEYVDYLQQNGQDASRYQLAYWRKVLQPVTVGAMLLLALSFIFGPLRSVTMAARVLLGILTGFGFYMSNEVFGPLALVYQLPPLAGAAIPSLLFIGISLYFMRQKI
ncbi:LPS export ABC transporter permease LptG [Alishewanella sp. SMS8]|uniref:LPS export ABC transporter permease LptG n=1 Tax=Alishewanella sp. SMS8 TaxID=2994676 RepID=UPI002741B344|nr:LPS export ABC transporter permease LptG [Alishewanella sp. SMS8]MDP5036511.1 LPS export ABC transporter permease LptG [Alishewanella sp.]MDP5187426.1 LPS export ABC transporter permease LptG [Alishewanella sp.]MDP5459619.1 LPS export ABC transporter permease LptG [Alishewanella sp. SMS8]